jgi:hypothetical protein
MRNFDPTRQAIQLPPGMLDDAATPAAVRKAAGEFQALQGRHRALDAEVLRDEDALERAEADQIRAEADALRAGKKAPANPIAKLREALEAKQRERAVLEQATRDSFTAFFGTLDAHRDEFAAALAEAITTERQGMTSAVDTLVAREQGLRERMITKLWLADFPGRVALRSPIIGTLPELPSANGEPYSTATIYDALREYATGEAGMAGLRGPFAPGQDQRKYRAALAARAEATAEVSS